MKIYADTTRILKSYFGEETYAEIRDHFGQSEEKMKGIVAFPLLHIAFLQEKSLATQVICKRNNDMPFQFEIEQYPDLTKSEIDAALANASQVWKGLGMTYIAELQDKLNECLSPEYAPYDKFDGLVLFKGFQVLVDYECGVERSMSLKNENAGEGSTVGNSSVTTTAHLSLKLSNHSSERALRATSIPHLSELLHQLCWILAARSIERGELTRKLSKPATNNNKSSDSFAKSTGTVFQPAQDEDLLAAIAGCPSILSHLAKVFGIKAFEVAVPEKVFLRRKSLLNYAEERTFEAERIESNWFRQAESLRGHLRFSVNVANFLDILSESEPEIVRERLSQYFNGTHHNELLKTPLYAFYKEHIRKASSRASLFDKLKHVNKTLNDEVLGQPLAVDSVCNHLSTILFGDDTRHLGVSTFVGASGVGKTYLAEIFAKSFNTYFHNGYECTVFNMEQMTDRHDVMKLWGSGAQYINSALGEITLSVMRNPRQIIVFDEIEKAAPEVTQSLLTLLEKASATDRTTMQEVDFSQCYFIFTTNLGSQTIQKNANVVDDLNVAELLSDQDKENGLSAEMINRLASGNLAVFRQPHASHLVKLAMRQFDSSKSESVYSVHSIDWQTNGAELLLGTLGANATPRNINTQLAKLSSRIVNGALDHITDGNYDQLKTLKVSHDIPVLDNSSRYVFFTNDDRLSSYFSDEQVIISRADSVASVHVLILNTPADGYLFDEDSIGLNITELCAMLNSLTDSVIYAVTGQSDSMIVNTAKASSVYRQLSLNGRKKTDFVRLLKIVDRNTNLIRTTETNIKRNRLVNYNIHFDISDMGIDVKFTDFSHRFAISKEDLELPFLKFDGKPDVSFSDILGQDAAKKRLKLIIDAMTQSGERSLDFDIPKGFILTGAPGVGKTMLAKALANECNCSFFNVNAADLLAGEVGKNINNLFDTLEKYSPAILNLDEIDAIGRVRASGSDINRLAVNTLLTRLDGFTQSDEQVFVLAATNDVQILDPALLRAGRLEKIVYCESPTAKLRREYLQSQLNSELTPVSQATLEHLVSATEGASIATLGMIVREALMSLKEEGLAWNELALIEILKTERFGKLNGNMVVNEAQRKIIAYHEAGHLLASRLLLPMQKVEFASIEARGSALGMVVSSENALTGPVTMKRIHNFLQIVLAGLAAEEMCGEDLEGGSIGASNDRRKATDIAVNAIREYGLSKRYGLAIPAQLSLSEAYVADEVNEWLQQAYDDVTALLKGALPLLTVFADALVAEGSLDHERICEIEADYHSSSLKLTG